MKKTKIIVLMIFTFLMSCTISPINAAQVAPDSTDNGVCPIGECSEYVVAGDIVRFGMKLYGNQAYKVEKVDLSSDKVYNSIIGAWIPAYSATKCDANGKEVSNQIIKVGDYFYPDHGDAYLYGIRQDGWFKVYDIYS